MISTDGRHCSLAVRAHYGTTVNSAIDKLCDFGQVIHSISLCLGFFICMMDCDGARSLQGCGEG